MGFAYFEFMNPKSLVNCYVWEFETINILRNLQKNNKSFWDASENLP